MKSGLFLWRFDGLVSLVYPRSVVILIHKQNITSSSFGKLAIITFIIVFFAACYFTIAYMLFYDLYSSWYAHTIIHTHCHWRHCSDCIHLPISFNPAVTRHGAPRAAEMSFELTKRSLKWLTPGKNSSGFEGVL